ncbi:ChaN family lipoprotein [candidate division KSB1 bacterium]|nr:ChaN family lipoprotein [candidate division KSB1 bacterium]
MIQRVIALCVFFIAANLFADENVFDTERLPIGDPARKYDFCAVKLDKILDTKANQNISTDQLIKGLQHFRIVMIGETHTNQLHHDMQLAVMKGLTEAGKKVCLALEMFTPSQNDALQKWVKGELTEDEFMDQVDYFNTWGHNYRYYQAIFQYAKAQHIPMFGVNTDHEYASKIGMHGLAGLSLEEAAAIPVVDTSNVEHRYFVKVAMEGMDATAPAQFKNIYAAQSLWDTVMGEGAIDVAKKHPDAIVLVFAGSGHVAYNLGIGRIINDRSEFPFASIVAVDVPDSVEESVMMKVKKSIKKQRKTDDADSTASDMSGTAMEKSPSHTMPAMPGMSEQKTDDKKMPPMSMMHGMGSMEDTPYHIVSRSLADFLWGKKQLKDEEYPSFGFSIDDPVEQGFPVKRIIPESIAEKQGLKQGDIIVSIDGTTFKTMSALKKHLHFKNWGDSITFVVLREDKKVTISFTIEPVGE